MLNVIFSFPTDNKEINTLRLLFLMRSEDSDRKKFGRRRASLRVGRARPNIPHFAGFSFQWASRFRQSCCSCDCQHSISTQTHSVWLCKFYVTSEDVVRARGYMVRQMEFVCCQSRFGWAKCFFLFTSNC